MCLYIYICIYNIQILRSIGLNGAQYAESLILAKNNLENIGSKKLGSTACVTGPGRYRAVRKISRNHSDKVACFNSGLVTSYDLKTKQVHEY